MWLFPSGTVVSVCVCVCVSYWRSAEEGGRILQYIKTGIILTMLTSTCWLIDRGGGVYVLFTKSSLGSDWIKHLQAEWMAAATSSWTLTHERGLQRLHGSEKLCVTRSCLIKNWEELEKIARKQSQVHKSMAGCFLSVISVKHSSK